jgi:excinuclease ABC subunit A
MDISDLTTWFKDLDSHLSDKQKRIATEVIKEIKDRLNFLMNVGLNYLALSRSSNLFLVVRHNVFVWQLKLVHQLVVLYIWMSQYWFTPKR